jgi:hypothetical protein
MPQSTINYHHIYNNLMEDSLKDSLGIPVRFCDLDDNNERFIVALIDHSYGSFCESLLMQDHVRDLEYLSTEISETLNSIVLGINNLRKDFSHA